MPGIHSSRIHRTLISSKNRNSYRNVSACREPQASGAVFTSKTLGNMHKRSSFVRYLSKIFL
jgi:hypothetical protein